MQHAGEDGRRENARPEMKKRKVSAFYTGLYVFMSFFFLVGFAFVMWFLVVYMQEDIASLRGLSLIGVILFFASSLIGLFLSLYMVLKGAFSAAYTVDTDGMTTYWRKNTYRLLWTDCVEFEIVQVPVNWSTSAAVVYCSTRVLSQKEKENFFWSHKNDFAHVQYFQYSSGAGAQLSGSESARAGSAGGVRLFRAPSSGGFHKQRLRCGGFCGIIKPICA